MAGVDIALPYDAGSLAASGGSIWVIPHLDEVVLRVDPTSNQVVEEIALPGVVGAEIDANADTVWLSVSTPGSFAPAGVVRLDATSGRITGPFTVDGVEGVFPKIGPDGVWVAGNGRYARLDAATGDVLEVIEAPGARGHLPTTQGLWIVHPDGIWNVETASSVLDEIGAAVSELTPGQIGAPFIPIAEHDGKVWGIGADNVVAIDLDSHEIAHTVDLPEGITPCPDGAVSESVLWLIADSSGECWETNSVLIGIDTATGNVSYHQPLQFATEYGMDVTSDDVWVPVIREPRIVRIPTDM